MLQVLGAAGCLTLVASLPWPSIVEGALVFVAGVIYRLVRKDTRNAVLIGLLVVSHWGLDAIVHAPDLPVTPGGEARIGLGVWNSLAATLAIEVPIFAIGAWLYASCTWSRLDRVGRWALAGLVAFLALIYVSNLLGPPPPAVPGRG